MTAETAILEAKNTIVLRALASMLHDFYTGVEKIFLNIAREIDPCAPRSENWHRLLLEQMILHLKDRRPVVIDKELAGDLLQYLAFRHRFRNLYGFDLEWERMEQPVKAMPDILHRLTVAINDFLNMLMEADA